MRAAAVLSFAVMTFAAVPAAAQQPLGDVLDILAALWARSDATAIADLVAVQGLELELQGRPVGPIGGRRVASALRRVFDEGETLSVVAAMTERVTGTDDRAFGELVWQVRSRGATVPERSTVFFALVREDRGWRVSQIRILP